MDTDTQRIDEESLVYEIEGFLIGKAELFYKAMNFMTSKYAQFG